MRYSQFPINVVTNCLHTRNTKYSGFSFPLKYSGFSFPLTKKRRCQKNGGNLQKEGGHDFAPWDMRFLVQFSNSSCLPFTRDDKPEVSSTTGSPSPVPIRAFARNSKAGIWWSARVRGQRPGQAPTCWCGNRGVGTSGSRPSCILSSRSGMVGSNSRDPGFSAKHT